MEPKSMTKQEIRDFLDNEHAVHSQEGQITRLYLKSGEMYYTYFRKENQRPELMEKNTWIFLPADSLLSYSEIKGDDIVALKSGKSVGKIKF